MTKRLLSVVLAAFMVLALVPMSIFARTVTPDDVRPSVTYTGQAITQDNPQVGGNFWWNLGVEEGSSLDSAEILVEFDARYLQVVGTNYQARTCLYYQINSGAITDSNNYVCFFTDNYAGATGDKPVGEEGKTYERIMFASQGYSLGGLNAGGTITRVQFQWVAVPPNGRLPLTINVVESNCFTTEEQALACDGNPSYAHATVTCLNESSYVEVTNSSYVPAEPETREVTFTGEIVDAGEVAVNDTFTWALSVSDNSGMMSGHWFIDFNEDYLTTTKVEYSYVGSVVDQIYATYDDDDMPTADTFSDMPTFVPNPTIQTQAAEGNAYGLVAGNYYNDIGMIISTFDYMGLQQGGQMFRYTYKWTAVPAVEDLMQDDNGYYLPMEFVVAEAKYRVENTAQYGVYDAINNVPGKIYVEIPAVPETYTITWVIDGVSETETYAAGETPTHAVPTKPADAQYTYTFAGWDPEIVPVTGDATYTATWTTTPVEYTITWVIDGVSETETYAYGETPAHAVPTKPADAQYTYTFAGWDPEIVPVAGDATYTATWTTTPRNYTITIYYLRYSDGLGDWVALQSSKTITVAYGAEYDVNDQIPAEIDGYILDHTEGVLAGTMPAENVEINAYYVVPPYEPVAPTVEGVKAEIRERAAADGKNDLRFIFKVTFNDSYVVEDGINYGPTEEYYKITKFYVEMLQGTSTTPKTLVCKALWTVAADNYQFTVVIKGIPESANSKVYTMTPFVDYAMGDVTGTATNDPLVASVDSVLND